jgi:hypothetical protein
MRWILVRGSTKLWQRYLPLVIVLDYVMFFSYKACLVGYLCMSSPGWYTWLYLCVSCTYSCNCHQQWTVCISPHTWYTSHRHQSWEMPHRSGLDMLQNHQHPMSTILTLTEQVSQRLVFTAKSARQQPLRIRTSWIRWHMTIYNPPQKCTFEVTHFPIICTEMLTLLHYRLNYCWQNSVNLSLTHPLPPNPIHLKPSWHLIPECTAVIKYNCPLLNIFLSTFSYYIHQWPMC